MDTDFDGVLFLLDFRQKWRKFVEITTKNTNLELLRGPNYQLCQKFVIWIIQNLSIFQDGFDFIADQRKIDTIYL